MFRHGNALAAIIPPAAAARVSTTGGMTNTICNQTECRIMGLTTRGRRAVGNPGSRKEGPTNHKIFARD